VGAQNVTPATADQAITQGYHNGTGKVVGDANLVPEKIADGVAIFGVTGTAKVATGDATAAEVLTGKTFSNAGAVNVSGTMANVGAQNVTPATADQAITQGYHNGTGKVAGDANLVTGNIKAGTTIFGVTGKTEVVDTTSGDAVAGELLSGKKAWVDGTEVTGTLETKTLSAANDTVAAGNYVATTLSTVDTDLVTGNIKAGTTIFGVTGKTEVVDTTSGDAVAGEIFSGKKAWVDGNELTGTLETKTLSAANDTVAAGNYVATTLSTVDTDLVTGNIKAGTTIFGVAGKTEVVDTTSGDAGAGEILNGKKAWVDGTEVTGTLETKTLSAANDAVAAGNYAATTLSTVDIDLVTANIKAGTTIFGVTGKTEVVDTTSGDAAAANLALGKKAWVDGSEVIGTLTGGVVVGTDPAKFSPLGRWYDNGDGTITDTTTGLIWLQKADWTIPVLAADGLSNSSQCSAGAPGANLSDGSWGYDWRIPTLKEADSIKNGTEGLGFNEGNVYFFTGVSTNFWNLQSVVEVICFGAPDGARQVWPVRGRLLH
ncbi:MAG: hypothetical protein KKB51_05865, partial [Candidatus Riflebacteria bacterium]|nr:hypothetical protein [Candidatus Riflebacteria bacterium]